MSAQKKTYSLQNTDFAGDTAIAAGYANHREEANHLGNVLAVVSDRKIAVEDQGNPGTVEYYEADVVIAQDYYPGGFPMPGRTINADVYRYGHDQQESDAEITGNWGSHYTAEHWMYDTRTQRRWNIDPVKVAWESGYAAYRNNPVYYIDPDGDFPSPMASDGRGGGSFGNPIPRRVSAQQVMDRIEYNRSQPEYIAYRKRGEIFGTVAMNLVVGGGGLLAVRSAIGIASITTRTLTTSGALRSAGLATEGTYAMSSSSVRSIGALTGNQETTEQLPTTFASATLGFTFDFATSGGESDAGRNFLDLAVGGGGSAMRLARGSGSSIEEGLDLLSFGGQLGSVSSESPQSYTVQQGDTLSGIASEFGTTVDSLSGTNEIDDPDHIEVGQELNIDQ